MRFIVLILVIAIIAGLAFFLWPKESIAPTKNETGNNQETKPMTSLTLKSPAFENNGFISKRYTCDGENINPPLEISNVPQNTQSLVLIVDDPDAPAGTWVHWTVWNIPPETQKFDENSKPAGVEGVTSFGKPGYGGPCPPSGTHRYFFKLYVLDTTLDLSTTAKKEDLEKVIKSHILEKTELVGLYKK